MSHHQENFSGTEEGVSAAAPHLQHTANNENGMDQEEHKANEIHEVAASAAAAAGVATNVVGGMEEENHLYDEEILESNDDLTIDEDKNSSEKTVEQENVKEKLIQQATSFKELWEKFNHDFDKSPSTTYFLLSTHWLKQWKKHVSYERVIKGKEPIYEYFAKFDEKLENANADLIQSTVSERSDEYFDFPDSNDGSSIILKPELKEVFHYTIVDRDIVNLLVNEYPGFKEIPRRAYKTPDGKKRIEIYYRKVNFVIVNHNLLKDIDSAKVKELTCKKIQLFSQENQEDLKHFLCMIVKKHQYSASYNYPQMSTIVSLQTIRLWKMKENDNVKNVYQQLHQSTRKFSSFEYRLKSPVDYAERHSNNTVEELSITDDSTILIEVQKQNGWFFKLEGEPDEDQCEFCRSYKVLKFECRCKKVQYCSESCKLRDQEYHARVCELAGEESEDEVDEPYKFENDSARGLCGLQNLGNTCFMNSALQCMSSTLPLTSYFLKKIYTKEINEQNVLGTQGKLAKQYGKFIKNLWTNNSRVFSPIALKLAVARLQQMFSGYQQHDSQEFLSYILDGLHEDLNRVKVKKYTESIDSNGRTDQVVAKESWLNHLKRNQSIVVDLMQGQFKSKVTCPDCQKESITFDPFLTCSLPIPNKEIKTMSMYMIFSNNRRVAVEVKYTYEPDTLKTVKDLKEYIVLKYSTTNHLGLFSLTFDRVKEQFDDNTPLETVRKALKEPQKNALMIEYDEEFSEENKVQIAFTFTRMKEEMYVSKRLVKSNFTFIRPFYLNKTANKKDVHLALFQYLKPIFQRGQSPDSQFNVDCKELSIEELYEKHVLNAQHPPYQILIESDAQEYINKPCSWCNQEKCKNCQLAYNNDEDPMDKFVKKTTSHYHTFRLECFVDMNTPMGKLVGTIHSLDNDNNSQNDGPKTDSADGKTTIYDCLKLFEQPEKLGEDNEWYCPQCQKHQKAQKQIVIYRAPDVLILHLKRFKGSGGLFKSKLTKVVDFPIRGLDMTDFVIEKDTPQSYYSQDAEYFQEIYIPPPQVQADHIDNNLSSFNTAQEGIDQETNGVKEKPAFEEESKSNNSTMDIESEQKGDKLLYDLYAITNHYGSLGFGHYTAFALNNNRWFCFDDSSVKDISQDQLISDASYILFYKRRR